MKNPYPKSAVMKTRTPGSGAGLANQSPIKSGPNVQQPFVSGHRIAKGKSVSSKKGPKNIGGGGKAKMAQGGEKESATGLSRTNMGRQRL